jgi:hypothetical protein
MKRAANKPNLSIGAPVGEREKAENPLRLSASERLAARELAPERSDAACDTDTARKRVPNGRGVPEWALRLPTQQHGDAGSDSQGQHDRRQEADDGALAVLADAQGRRGVGCSSAYSASWS